MGKLRAWFVATLVSAPLSFTATAFADETSTTPAYYTIEEVAPLQAQSLALGQSQSVNSYFSIQGMVLQARQAAVSLLRWAMHRSPAPTPTEPYDRLHHFGRWINDPTDETCYNTRSKVLIRDSAAPVSFRSQNHCVVDRGAWNEPYTGQKVVESRAIQIDHMVPLKNAYLSGAWQWNFQTRCMYANFMGNKFHLISADGIENMKKGDRGPDKYLPPANTYRCEYLMNWLRIKLIWRLRMTQDEVAAIQREVQQNHCNPRDFMVTDAQLRGQRRIITSAPEMCPEQRPQR